MIIIHTMGQALLLTKTCIKVDIVLKYTQLKLHKQNLYIKKYQNAGNLFHFQILSLAGLCLYQINCCVNGYFLAT